MLTTALLLCLAAGPAPKPAAPKGPLPPLTFGLTQTYGEEHAKKTQAALAPYLTAHLGGPVTVQIFPTPDELRDALAAGKIDLAWMTPLAFVQASQKNADVAALCKATRKGNGFYRAAFVVKKDSAAKTLGDLQGKRVAWVSKSSTSGYLFSRELLRKEGKPDTFFGAETFAGEHGAACKAVLDGKADVCATFSAEAPQGTTALADGCADTAPVGEFRVVITSGLIPNDVIAARPDFPPVRLNDTISTFGRMAKDPAGQPLLKDGFRADGWLIAVDGDFDPVLELLRAKDTKAKVAPSEDKPKKK